MNWQTGEHRIKNGNRAVILNFDAEASEPIVGKVLSNTGWHPHWWYANGHYRSEGPSLWDLVHLVNPVQEVTKEPEVVKEPEPKKESMIICPQFLIGGKRAYLYALQDVLSNGGATPVRISLNPKFGQGFIPVDSLQPTKGNTFEFAITNPVYDTTE